jgi:hypothetical protein
MALNGLLMDKTQGNDPETGEPVIGDAAFAIGYYPLPVYTDL